MPAFVHFPGYAAHITGFDARSRARRDHPHRAAELRQVLRETVRAGGPGVVIRRKKVSEHRYRNAAADRRVRGAVKVRKGAHRPEVSWGGMEIGLTNGKDRGEPGLGEELGHLMGSRHARDAEAVPDRPPVG